ncbi:MAG TPA: hypothetical protein DCO75_10180 [Fibrobacteres bacterium]|jgi:hypothetical protein|nr:hypothetical protein [Fibrobacterota bacterium]
MSKIRLIAIFFVFLLNIAIFCGCSKTDNLSGTINTGSGIASLKIHVTAGSLFKSLAQKAILTIAASDMLTITKNLTITDTSVEGTVTGIPSGKNRLFNLAVYDSLDSLQYKGSSSVNVFTDSTIDVTITIIRVSGNANINVVVEESDSIPKDGLVAYYPFTGNANDLSGNGHNGAVYNAILSKDRFGTQSSAYSFSDSAYIDLKNDSMLQSEKFTISMWAMTDTISVCNGPGDCGQSIICYTPSTWALGPAWELGLTANTSGDKDSLLFFRMWSSTTKWEDIICTTAVLINNWYHFVGTYDGTTQKSYVNGNLINSQNATLSYSDLDRVLIGASKQTSTGALTQFWSGKIDDIRIYSRALSSTEILALYHEGGWTGK